MSLSLSVLKSHYFTDVGNAGRLRKLLRLKAMVLRLDRSGFIEVSMEGVDELNPSTPIYD